MLGIPMAMLYSALAGGGMGILGNMLGRGDAPEQGYDIVQMPTYPWAEGTQQAVNSYLMDMMNAYARGEAPPWMSVLDPIQEGMQGNLRDRFYGSAGRPGILQDQMSMGAMTGVGPKAAMARGSQATYDYMSEADKIDQYIAGLKFPVMAQQSTQVPGMLANMPRGPETQIVPYGGFGGGQSGGGGASGDWSGLGNALGYSMYNQNQPAGTQQAQYWSQFPYGGNYMNYMSPDYGSNVPASYQYMGGNYVPGQQSSMGMPLGYMNTSQYT